MKTLLNNLRTHIGREDDGHLVHTDKRIGKQLVSIKIWPSLVSAQQALAIGFSKIEWEELNEPPPVALVLKQRKAERLQFVQDCYASDN